MNNMSEIKIRKFNNFTEPIVGKNVVATGELGLWDCRGQITIGDYAFLAHGVKLLTSVHDYNRFNKDRQTHVTAGPIIIGRGAWVASYAIILAGVSIGDHSVIGAGSVVTRDIPSYQLWAGNPAKYIKDIDEVK